MDWSLSPPVPIPTAAIAEMRQILENYAQKGVPADLVEAAKRSEIASAEFNRNSIPGLADVWSDALAAEGRNSPDEDLNAIKRVTLADVNRVAKKYLLSADSITAILKPVPTGQAVSAKGFGGQEQVTQAPSKPVELPAWAKGALAQLKVPTQPLAVSDTVLPNGLRLIVKTDHISPTISVIGSVKNNSDLQTPKGQEGVSDLLDGLFSYGTTDPGPAGLPEGARRYRGQRVGGLRFFRESTQRELFPRS